MLALREIVATVPEKWKQNTCN